MSSMDYVFDLTDKLEQNNFQYVLATLRPGEKVDKIDVFYWIPDELSRKELATVLGKISEDLLTKTDDEIQKERTIEAEGNHEASDEDEDEDDFFKNDEEN
jgi:hypothetical protein